MDVKLYRLFFRATSSGTLPRYSGGMARGMLFKQLREHDKHLAKEVHDQEGVKKFAITGFRLMPLPDDPLTMMNKALRNSKRQRNPLAKPGQILYFDVATSSEVLANSLPKLLTRTWEGDQTGLELEPLQIVPADLEDIMQTGIPNPVTVRFITPLSFTTGSTYFVWPDPIFMMRNLLSIWNAWFHNSQIDQEKVMETHANNIQVQYAKGRVQGASAAKGMAHNGWTGTVRYGSTSKDSFEIFANLLKLGFLSGVGRGRTAGLGRFYIPDVLHNYDIVKLV